VREILTKSTLAQRGAAGNSTGATGRDEISRNDAWNVRLDKNESLVEQLESKGWKSRVLAGKLFNVLIICWNNSKTENNYYLNKIDHKIS